MIPAKSATATAAPIASGGGDLLRNPTAFQKAAIKLGWKWSEDNAGYISENHRSTTHISGFLIVSDAEQACWMDGILGEGEAEHFAATE